MISTFPDKPIFILNFNVLISSVRPFSSTSLQKAAAASSAADHRQKISLSAINIRKIVHLIS